MKPNSRPGENIRSLGFAAIVISASIAACSQQQPPTVTRPTASSAQATPRKTNSPYGSAIGTQAELKRASGAITGFVYWQMSVLQPQADCQGLTVKVATVSKSGMPLQLLATTNTFTAMGPVTDYSTPGTPKYMLCSYSLHNLPENVSLRTLLYGPPSKAFVTPPAFQIPGGTCASGPPSTLSFMLTGGEMLCGDGAFNINFKLTPPTMAGSAVTAPLLNGPVEPKGMLANSGTTPAHETTARTPNQVGGATLLPGQTNAAGGVTASAQPGLLTAKAGGNGNSARTIGGAGGYAGTTQPGDKNPGSGVSSGGIKPADATRSSAESWNSIPGAPIASGSFVPQMPPLSSNPKRDASQPITAGEKAKIRSQLKSQFLAAHPGTGRSGQLVVTLSHANVPEIQALQQQMNFVTSLRTEGFLTKKALLVAQNPNQVRIQPPSASNPLLHAPPTTTICPSPQIHAVNGKTSGVVFTQDPQYNDYVITGCGFGSQEGQVYLAGAIANGRINMAVKPGMWSDTQIEARFLSGLTGVRDGWPDLIVAPISGSPAKFPNSRFYAQRQSVLLPYIAQQYANLANVPVGDGTHGSGTMYCPGPGLTKLFPCIAFNAGVKLDGMTNGVDHRNDTNSFAVSNAVDREGGQQQFNPGEDTFDLSYMAPGFEIDDVTTFWYDWIYDVCEGWASDAFPKKFGDSVGADVQGYYSTNVKSKTKIVIDWAVPHCGWRWLGIFRVDDWYNSGYSLQVKVIGPIGVDPWTGLPIPKSPNVAQPQPNTLKAVP